MSNSMPAIFFVGRCGVVVGGGVVVGVVTVVVGGGVVCWLLFAV